MAAPCHPPGGPIRGLCRAMAGHQGGSSSQQAGRLLAHGYRRRLAGSAGTFPDIERWGGLGAGLQYGRVAGDLRRCSSIGLRAGALANAGLGGGKWTALQTLSQLRGYGDYCPIAKATEVLGERWTPLILRNIYLRCHTFNEIQRGCPRMSSTLLSHRLRSLERDGVVERVPAPNGRGSRYYLTAAGQELTKPIAG